MARALGGVLMPGQHIEAFSSATELRRLVQRLQSQPEARLRMAERARTHLAANHCYTNRVEALLGSLGNLPMAKGAGQQ